MVSLKKYLKEKFGDVIRLAYVDVASNEMKNYPDIPRVMSNIRPPLIVLNGEARFYGGISPDMIGKAVSEILSSIKRTEVI